MVRSRSPVRAGSQNFEGSLAKRRSSEPASSSFGGVALAPRALSAYNAPARGTEVMANVAFDTLKFAQNLRDKANFSPAQAEGVSQAFSEAIAGQLATRDDLINLATKDDVSTVKDELKRLESKIEASKSETLRWIVGAIGFQTIAMMD